MDSPFLGQAYAGQSLNLASNQLINLYPELVPKTAAQDAKKIGAFFTTPGLDLLGTVGSGPIRALQLSADLGTMYVVSGNTVYSVNTDFAATSLGTISSGTVPVSAITNPTQIAVFDGTSGYVITGNTFAQISLPFSGAVSATYQDGFGVVNQSGTQNWFQSNLDDFTTWSALAFSKADSQPDNLIAIGDLSRQVFLFKANEAEVWINAGLPNFVFSRLDGPYINAGIAAVFSLAKCGYTLVWLGQSDNGSGVIYMLKGYEAIPISTPAIEYALSQYPTLSDAVAFSYLQNGHLFYVISFPSGNATWSFDLTTGMWHQRAALLNGAFNRHPANCHAFFAGKHVVGDASNGNLYNFNLNGATDNGVQRKWLRSWRALPKPQYKPVTFSSLQIDMETGIHVPSGTNPQCMLRWSDDGMHTFRASRIAAVGKTGETTRRVMFRRLGSTKMSHGLDRTFELSSTDQFPAALIGADLN